MQRNLGLDLLKVLSCFFVVTLHSTGSLATTDISGSFNLAKIMNYISTVAVPLFFMVNGYFLLNKDQGYKKMATKIYGVLLIIFLWGSIYYFIKMATGKGGGNYVASILEPLLQIGSFYQFWFFGSLLILYLLVPIIRTAFRNVKTALLVTAIMVIVCAIIDVLGIASKTQFDMNVTQTFRMWTWVCYYMLGGCLGLPAVQEKLEKLKSLKLWAAIFVVSLVVLYFYQDFLVKNIYGKKSAEFFYNSFVVMLIATLMFISISKCSVENKLLRSVVLFISPAIMGVFIVHVLILSNLQKIVNFDTSLKRVLLTFIVFFISLAISKLLLMNKITKKLVVM